MYLQISVSQVRNITRHSNRTQDRRSRLLSRFSVRLRRVTVKLRAFLTLKDDSVLGNVCDRPVARRAPPMWSARGRRDGRGRRSAPPREPPKMRPGKAGGAASLMHRAAARASFGGAHNLGAALLRRVLRRCCGCSASGECGGCSGWSDSSGLLRVPRMPHAPPQVLPHLTLRGRLSAP